MRPVRTVGDTGLIDLPDYEHTRLDSSKITHTSTGDGPGYLPLLRIHLIGGGTVELAYGPATAAFFAWQTGTPPEEVEAWAEFCDLEWLEDEAGRGWVVIEQPLHMGYQRDELGVAILCSLDEEREQVRVQERDAWGKSKPYRHRGYRTPNYPHDCLEPGGHRIQVLPHLRLRRHSDLAPKKEQEETREDWPPVEEETRGWLRRLVDLVWA